jgi:hypothetical protein
MNARLIAIVACLALASVPAPARQQAKVLKPAVQARHKPGRKLAHKAAPKSAPKKTDEKKTPAATATAYAKMSPGERLAIQADLAWTNYYEGPPGGNFDDERVIDAAKLFQKANKGKDTGILTDEERAHLAAAAEPHRQAVGWRTIGDPATGTRFGLPEKLVSPLGPSRLGSRWNSGHGQIQIYAFRLSDASLPALFEEEKKTPHGRYVESSSLESNSFVMSGTQGLKYFVVRAESSGSEVRGISILYDQATVGTMAPVALAIANSFEGFPDPNATLPPDQESTVEYGTAIAVDHHGDLISTDQVTADCDAIMVPGLGHAVLIAEDKAADLVLIRLYGAHKLTPAPVWDESQDDDLILVGIADPATQQGGDAVTRLAVHFDGQNLEPAPKAGFSGAAAVDAQGRFAGIVALRSPPVADTGAISQQAALVPAAAVRAFLKGHDINPASAQDTIDQSVVRVICVRK